MRRPAAIALLAVSLAALPAGAGAAPGASISIGPIQAVFVPSKRETVYSVSRFHLNGKPEAVTVSWSLRLELVDKAGAPEPGTAGTGAAVDLGCTNAGVGIPEPQKNAVEPGHPTTRFVWHHPDAADSAPPGRYHCDHADMGPHGHQGLITVVVADKAWRCTATYKGTNSSTAGSTKDGTAGEPRCTPVG